MTVIVAPDSAALMPARAELARINAQIAMVLAERDGAQRLLDQRQDPESELALVETQLQGLREQRERDRAAWNDAGCLGDPPAVPPDLLTLERARARLRERLGANEAPYRLLQAWCSAPTNGSRICVCKSDRRICAPL